MLLLTYWAGHQFCDVIVKRLQTKNNFRDQIILNWILHTLKLNRYKSNTVGFSDGRNLSWKLQIVILRYHLFVIKHKNRIFKHYFIVLL